MNSTVDIELYVRGMHCANCAMGVERLLKDRFAAQNTNVDFATDKARFSLRPETDLHDVIHAIEGLGYAVSTSRKEGGLKSKQDERRLKGKFAVCLLLTLPLFLHMFFPASFLGNPWLQLGLCTPVFLISLSHFGVSAVKSLRGGLPNMDVLIIIGVTSAFLYSLYGTLFGLGHNFLFYETAATITTLVLLGNYIEKRAVQKTTSAISELSAFQPEQAKKLPGKDSTNYEVISADELQLNDFISINSGDRVPADSKISSGSLEIDESMLTGESTPVLKSIGDTIVTGTIVLSGSAKAQVSALGDDTVLSRLIRLVESAQTTKPEIQRLGDLVSAYFVPVVVVFSMLTFLFTLFVLGLSSQEAMLRAVAVLVIACPCAMGLATPTAIMVAVGRAAREGILIKGGDTLERLARVKSFVFDKTGTLTTGEFHIEESFLHQDCNREEVLGVVRGLELHSSHPIAQSIHTRYADIKPVPLSEVREEKGKGMRGVDQDGQAWSLLANTSEQEHKGDILVYKGEQVVFGFSLEDTLRDGAQDAVSQIRSQGLGTLILSGDSEQKVSQVASELHIETYQSRLLPEEKLSALENLEAFAFVGDGVNDAPALARADVGISLSNATDIAIDSAQVVLVGNRLSTLPRALSLSRVTLLTIKQNLFWAFLYNILAIPIAACGFLSPMLAALTMALSDVFVIGNSLRLKCRDI